jgi:hypothetical protein
MSGLTSQYVELPNLGYVLCDIPEPLLGPIKREIAEIQADFDSATPHNYELAGNIKREYKLLKSRAYTERLLRPLAEDFLKNTDPYSWFLANGLQGESRLELTSLWVNYQQRHEFNPPHTHMGVLSFALWIQIPFTVEEERALSPEIPGQTNAVGSFNFQYTNSLGNIKNFIIPADRSFENRMVLFPAKMTHSVNPFYSSDGYRISVSGNFHIRESKDD